MSSECGYCLEGASREQQELPGFCGRCTCCGEPGHVRHHPSAPCSAIWCRDCYGKLGRGISLAHLFHAALVLFSLGLILHFAFR